MPPLPAVPPLGWGLPGAVDTERLPTWDSPCPAWGIMGPRHQPHLYLSPPAGSSHLGQGTVDIGFQAVWRDFPSLQFELFI